MTKRMKKRMKRKRRMVSFSFLLFFIAVSACVLALGIGTPESTDARGAPSSSSAAGSRASSSSQSSSGTVSQASGMKSNGPASLKLADISHYDVITDWTALKNSIDGIYIKATEGVTYTDPQFVSFSQSAAKVKLPFGFYHYFWPRGNAENDRQQADFFYSTIKACKYELYPVLDVEETNGQTAATISDDVKAFCDEFKRLSGLQIIIYCSPNYADTYLGDRRFENFPLWIAHYNVAVPKNTVTWHNYVVWQYNSKITLPGVSGPIDGDVATANVFISEASIGDK